MTIQIGYAGRLGHRGLVQSDLAQPLTLFKDPKSGQTWAQASKVYEVLANNGLTASQAKANPSSAPVEPFLENMFPGAKNEYITTGAFANYFYDLFGNYAGSTSTRSTTWTASASPTAVASRFMDAAHSAPMQDSSLESFVNAGKSACHAAQGYYAVRCKTAGDTTSTTRFHPRWTMVLLWRPAAAPPCRTRSIRTPTAGLPTSTLVTPLRRTQCSRFRTTSNNSGRVMQGAIRYEF
jgi:hypothetical protein